MTIVNPFVDFATSNDSGENNADSVQPIANGEAVNNTIANRAGENLRKRTEVLRALGVDALFLQNADRGLVLAGPGKVSWPGSTTAGASGIPTLSDTLWILPQLTPGFPQTAPVPPVASAFGTLYLKRVTGSMDAILVTSQRRSYAAGDQINITVTSGAVFSCTLEVEDTGTYRRTIQIVATGATTLSTVITALNGLTPPAPDNTQLVTAALAGGAAGSDIILAAQARQFVSGNYDGEGHTLTPANLASFFSSNPGSVLAEGDSLCVQFAQLSDTASTGGRRQAIPENSNTTVTAGMFFNSRVDPEKLVNALPICKVVNGSLVFATGVEMAAGSFGLPLSNTAALQRVLRDGGFDRGLHVSVAGPNEIFGWRIDTAGSTNGIFRRGSTQARSGRSSLELNKTSVAATASKITYSMMFPVVPAQSIRIVTWVRQLIAPTAGTYTLRLTWGDEFGTSQITPTDITFQSIGVVDGAYRAVTSTVAVPASRYSLVKVDIIAVGITAAATGVALVVDEIQVYAEVPPEGVPNSVDIAARRTAFASVVVTDPGTIDEGAALWSYKNSSGNIAEATPVPPQPGLNLGYVVLENATELAADAPVGLAVLGSLAALGWRLLDSAAKARAPRQSVPHSATHAFTLLYESAADTSGVATRMYASAAGEFLVSVNALYSATNTWTKDVNGTSAFMSKCVPHGFETYHQLGSTNSWATWLQISKSAGSVTTSIGTPIFHPLQEYYDDNNARRVAIDHLGMRGGRVTEYFQTWIGSIVGSVINGWTIATTGTGTFTLAYASDGVTGPHAVLAVSANNDVSSVESPYLFSFADLTSSGEGSQTVHVLEWEADASAIIGAVTGTLQMGLIHDKGVNSDDGIYLSKTSADTNFQFITCESGTKTTSNTGVPPNAANTCTRFRIEMFGDDTPSAMHANCYINGALVASQATNMPNTDPMPIAFWLKSTSAVGGKAVRISPVRYSMYRVTEDDRL